MTNTCLYFFLNSYLQIKIYQIHDDDGNHPAHNNTDAIILKVVLRFYIFKNI